MKRTAKRTNELLIKEAAVLDDLQSILKHCSDRGIDSSTVAENILYVLYRDWGMKVSDLRFRIKDNLN